MFKHKSHDEVNDDGTTKGEEGQVDKIHAHGGGADAEFGTPPGADAESALLEPLCNCTDHTIKISKIIANAIRRLFSGKCLHII